MCAVRGLTFLGSGRFFFLMNRGNTTNRYGVRKGKHSSKTNVPISALDYCCTHVGMVYTLQVEERTPFTKE